MPTSPLPTTLLSFLKWLECLEVGFREVFRCLVSPSPFMESCVYQGHQCLVDNLLCQPLLYLPPLLGFLKWIKFLERFGEPHPIYGDLWYPPNGWPLLMTDGFFDRRTDWFFGQADFWTDGLKKKFWAKFRSNFVKFCQFLGNCWEK